MSVAISVVIKMGQCHGWRVLLAVACVGNRCMGWWVVGGVC